MRREEEAEPPVLCHRVCHFFPIFSRCAARLVGVSLRAGQPDLAALSKGFSYEWCMAVGWAHFIAMDLFVGRWIYLDSRKNNVFAVHSLLLCLFFGPTGVISHVLTRGVTGLARGEKLADVMAPSPAPIAADKDA